MPKYSNKAFLCFCCKMYILCVILNEMLLRQNYSSHFYHVLLVLSLFPQERKKMGGEFQVSYTDGYVGERRGEMRKKAIGKKWIPLFFGKRGGRMVGWLVGLSALPSLCKVTSRPILATSATATPPRYR